MTLNTEPGSLAFLLLLFSFFAPPNNELAILTSPLSLKDLMKVLLSGQTTIGVAHTQPEEESFCPLLRTWCTLAQLLSRVRLFVTPRTVVHQAPLPMEFSRQEYWSGLPYPPPGVLQDPGVELGFPALQADSLPSEPPGKLYIYNGRLFSH